VRLLRALVSWRFARMILVGILSLVAAPIVMPLGWVLRKLSAKTRAIREAERQRPHHIPSLLEMAVLEPRVADEQPGALELWIRGGAYYKLALDHGYTPKDAALGAEELVAQVNTPGGLIGVTVEKR
jgi:hypothetical protein